MQQIDVEHPLFLVRQPRSEAFYAAVEKVNDHFAVNEDFVAAASKAVVQLATTEMYLQRAIGPSLPCRCAPTYFHIW
jgi:hypothetical protein